MTEKEAEDLAKLRSLMGDKTPDTAEQSVKVLTKLRDNMDEAQRNFAAISADVVEMEERFDEGGPQLRDQLKGEYADLLASQSKASEILFSARIRYHTEFLSRLNRTGNK